MCCCKDTAIRRCQFSHSFVAAKIPADVDDMMQNDLVYDPYAASTKILAYIGKDLFMGLF